MDCVEAKKMMESYASDRLAPDAKSGLEEHIAACEGCRLEVELVRAMGSAPPKSPSGSGDEWTIDRIFGAGAARAPEAASTNPAAGTSAGQETPAADPAEPFAPEQFTPPATGAPGPPAPELLVPLAPEPLVPPSPELLGSPAPLEPGAPSVADTAGAGADASIEKTPTPPPPESVSAASVPSRAPAVAPNDSDSSFADLQLESIQASSIADPAGPRKPPGASPERAADRTMGPRKAKGRAAATQGMSWEFEPTDVRPDEKPPEGSLFFAEETLTRKAAARDSRSSVLRTALWAAGSVVGLALLGLSIWIAVEMQRPSQAPPPVSAGSPTPPGTESEPPAASSPVTVPQETPGDETNTNTPAVPDAGATAPTAPGPSRVIEAAAVRPPSASPEAPAKSAAPPAKSAAPTAKGATGSATGPASPAKSRVSSVTRPASQTPATGQRAGQSVQSSTPAPKQPPPATGKQAVTTLERALPLGGASDLDEIDETPAPDATRIDPSPATGPKAAPAKPTESPKPSPAVVTPPPAPGPSTSSSSAPGATPPETPPAATSDPSVERPIDRLHIATVNAAQNSDVSALRKLRDTWKGFVRASVGPDRARGKRELADCLWEIQSLTGRNSDKKDALLAYREYVLTAPAGGADARTVARMRQLEDAMSESH